MAQCASGGYKTMKVALYTRVSTEDQAREGFSLEVQRDFLLKYAKDQGWEVFCSISGARVYQDDGVSGYTMDRPALQRLLADAGRKSFDLVLVYKQDRLSRNLKDMLNLLDQLARWGIGYKSATEPFDTTTSAGKMALHMLGTYAEFERNRLVERVFPGMIKGVQKGNWQGARYAPYGYSYNKEKKLLEAVPNEVSTVKKIYEMYLSHKSTTQIAGHFYKQGIKTRSGGKFQTKLICDILKNHVYLGKLVWNRKHYDKNDQSRKTCRAVPNPPDQVIVAEGRHEAIITQEVFDKVQARLRSNRKGGERAMTQFDYPFTGVLVCARCNHRMHGISAISNAAKKKRKRWYRCSAAYMHDIKCKNSMVRAEMIEPALFAIIEKLACNKEILKVRLSRLIKAQAEPCEAFSEMVKEQNRLIQDNLRRQKKLADAYDQDCMAFEVYKEKSVDLRDEEKRLRNRLSELELKLLAREKQQGYQQYVKEVLGRFDDAKEELDSIRKKEVVRVVFKEIRVKDRKVVGFELFEPFKSFLEGKNPCQKKFLEEIAVSDPLGCLSQPSAAR